jgi:hypothetical protein
LRLAGPVVVAVALVAGCPGPNGAGNGPPLSDLQGADDPLTRPELLRDLESEVLDGYDRDEPIDPQIGVIDPVVGAARIGVGPGDVWVGAEVGLGTSRWPLTTDRTITTTTVSKKLELHISDDRSAAWVNDEVSWRLGACDRIAVVPLRLTALYVRDGDRWSPVVEHLSYGRTATPDDRADFGAAVSSAVANPEIAAAVDAALAPILTVERPATVKLLADAFALGPDVMFELRGDEIAATPLFSGSLAVEQRRIGIVERSPGKIDVAYWIGTLIGTASHGPVRLRGTFVFERRGGEWKLAQAHVSLPFDDDNLADVAFGGALLGLNPLRIGCR